MRDTEGSRLVGRSEGLSSPGSPQQAPFSVCSICRDRPANDRLRLIELMLKSR